MAYMQHTSTLHMTLLDLPQGFPLCHSRRKHANLNEGYDDIDVSYNFLFHVILNFT